MYDALYARQSIEKKDSISVESQLAYCRYETHGEACMEYTDKGFSGKDTKRLVRQRNRRPGQEEIVTANVTDTEDRLKQITNHVKAWETLSSPDRQAVVDTLIKIIRIADGNIEITWNI